MTEKISVIIPTYNERDNIVHLVHEIHKQIINYEHEIVVVDDNSPDGTFKTVKGIESAPYLKAILRSEDRGFAKSIRCGIENSDGDIVLVMDSDFNHQPKYLPFMIETIKFYDCVTGSRFLYGGNMDTKIRHLLSWIFNIFVRLMTGGQVTDSLYGFFAVKRKILQEVNFDDVFWGYGDYCIRLLYYLQERKVDIIQFPAVNGRRRAGEGNNRFFKVFGQYFIAVLKLAYIIRLRKKSK